MKKNTFFLLMLASILAGAVTAQTVIFSENFEGGSLPSGWAQSTNATDGGWKFGTAAALSSSSWTVSATNTTKIAASNDDACNCDKSSDILKTPALDFSGYGTVIMSVDVFFQEGTYQGDTETSRVDVSTDGGTTWATVLTLAGEDEWRTEGIDLSAYAGMSSVIIGFNYGDAGGWLFGSAIDNVEISEPLDYEIGISEITMLDWALLSDGPQTVSGVITNYGGQTVTSADVSWSVDGGTVSTQTITGLNIAPLASGTFSHPDTWTPSSTGIKTITVSTSGPNGNADLNTSNDEMSMEISAVGAVVPRKVLFENFTSSTCGPCAPANATMLGLLGKLPDAGNFADKWTVVKYQMSWPTDGDPYYTAEGGTRRTYYNVNAVPSLWLDGGWGLNGNALTAGVINEYAAIPSFLDISATHTISGQTVSCDVSVTAVENYTAFSSNNLVLHMAIVEKETYNNAEPTGAPEYGNGETAFQFVMKKMMPNASGTAIGPFTVGTPVTASETYTFNGSYILPPNAQSPANLAIQHTVEEFGDLTVVVWVQNNDTKEVFQSAWSEYTCGVASATSTNASCGSFDGSATATTTGSGTSYLWSDPAAQTTATATGLAAGVYSVTITDPLGCEVSTSVTVNNTGGPTVLSQAIANTCSDGASGLINLTVSGGSSPYNYLWSNGSTTQNISGLVNGAYSVTVTDAAGCKSFKSATITGPNPITVTSIITNSTGADGAINLSVTGGTPNYAYLWDNGATTQDLSGIGAGTYSVTITDGFGCTYSGSFTVTGSVGIEAVEGLADLKVYPNPFNHTTNVELSLLSTEQVSLHIVNVVGQVVYSRDLGVVGKGLHVIPLSGEALSPGIYFVKIQVGPRSVTRKIVRNQ